MPKRTHKKHGAAHKHLHKKVLFQLFLFPLIALIMFGVVIVDAITHNLSLWWVVGGAVCGILAGLAMGRIFAVMWHEDTQKVIISIDKLSIVLIGAYIAFRLASDHFLSEFLHGQTLTVVTYSFLGGIMLGRMLSMYRSVRRILKQQRII